MASYDEAMQTLYQAPHEAFVGERQRLTSELKVAGDKAAALRLAKLPRPSISAWAVNQLWWQARATFDELFETAHQLRQGKLAARSAHRQALAQLSARARQVLGDAGHAVSESTLRRIEMTLAGLSAAGGFEPDPPGALSKDRDPPGFEAFGEATFGEAPTAEPKQREQAESKKAHAEAEAERRRAAQEQAKKRAERLHLEAAVTQAKHELAAREDALQRATKAAAAAEKEADNARLDVEQAEAKLAALE